MNEKEQRIFYDGVIFGIGFQITVFGLYFRHIASIVMGIFTMILSLILLKRDLRR